MLDIKSRFRCQLNIIRLSVSWVECVNHILDDAPWQIPDRSSNKANDCLFDVVVFVGGGGDIVVCIKDVSRWRTFVSLTIGHCRGYSSLNTVIPKWFLCRYLRWMFALLIYWVMCTIIRTTITTCILRPASKTLSCFVFFFFFSAWQRTLLLANFTSNFLSFDPFRHIHLLILFTRTFFRQPTKHFGANGQHNSTISIRMFGEI